LTNFIASIQQDKQKIIGNLDSVLPTAQYIGFASVSLVTRVLICLLLLFLIMVIALLSTALIAGITMCIVYACIGLPNPVLFGFVTAVASMVLFMVTR
jgi:predicted PurR-regulated permease PerM